MSPIGELRTRLLGYCEHIPPAIVDGSWNEAIDFKQSVAAARKLLAKARASESELRAAISKLHNYWERKA
jgi:hypothetical protein